MKINGLECIVLNMGIRRDQNVAVVRHLNSQFCTKALSLEVDARTKELILCVDPDTEPDASGSEEEIVVNHIYTILRGHYWETFILELLDLVQSHAVQGKALTELLVASGNDYCKAHCARVYLDPMMGNCLPLNTPVDRDNIMYLAIGAIHWAITYIPKSNAGDALAAEIKAVIDEYISAIKGSKTV
jgi:hypothetical protein